MKRKHLVLAILGILVLVAIVAVIIWQAPAIKRAATAKPTVAKETAVVPATPTPTATAQPTEVVAMPTLTTVAPTSAPTEAVTNVFTGTTPSGLVYPEFFEGQSTGKEYRASYDVGVKPNQIGIVFAFQVEWNGRALGDPDGKCALVVLKPGWYPALAITDGRYEVYDLPSTDQELWIRDLFRIRNEEQNTHYGCSLKEMIVWESDRPAVVWNDVAVVPTLTATKSTGTPAPTATPTAQARARVASGKTGTAKFVQGDEVWGWAIILDSGPKCEGRCYLPVAPGSGVVKDGVVNPWKGEVPNGTSPWTPS